MSDVTYYDGGRARVRRLVDGRWCAEVLRLVGWFKADWVPIDGEGWRMTWNDIHAYRCAFTERETAIRALANRGVGPNEEGEQ